MDPSILELCSRLLGDGPASVDLDAIVLARPDFALALCTADGWVDMRVAGAIAAIGPEWIATVRDVYLPVVPENPATGRAWEPGEAAALAVDGDGLTSGLVTAALLLDTATRDGDGDAWVVPYVRFGGESEAGVVSFGQPERIGDCPEWMTKAMTIEPVDVARVPQPGHGFAFDPEGPFHAPAEGRMALDVGVSRSLGRTLRERGGSAVVYTSAAYAEELRTRGIANVQVHVPA